MPTVSIDITDKYLNLFEEFKNDDSVRNPLNPGQIYALEDINLEIDATANVTIAGNKVDVEVKYQASYEYRDYISETVDILKDLFKMYTDQIAELRGFDADSLIDEAFASL